ncbi:MAG: GAF domain-containing protein [Lyngbya sp. HA4199-MV5]|jgi:putative methionine-R-sulfoxide reductase with GAF domain|nr:GAF domain-containing protein [Lyngbya sp. HA4199-MV5]
MVDIYTEIKRLEALAAEIRQQGYLQDCRLERATAGGTASGTGRSEARYARLRTGKRRLLPNGAKSQYISLQQIPETEAAIERGRMLQRIEKQLARLQSSASKAIDKTTSAITSPEIDRFCKHLFRWLQTYMAVDTVTLLLSEAHTDDLTVRSTIGLEEEIVQQIRIPIGQGFAGGIAATQAPMLVEDLAAVAVVSPILRHRGLQSMVGVPLQFGSHGVGVLHVGTFRSRKFSQREIQQLQLIVNLLQSVIANESLLNAEFYGIFNTILIRIIFIRWSIVRYFGFEQFHRLFAQLMPTKQTPAVFRVWQPGDLSTARFNTQT